MVQLLLLLLLLQKQQTVLAAASVYGGPAVLASSCSCMRLWLLMCRLCLLLEPSAGGLQGQEGQAGGARAGPGVRLVVGLAAAPE
jgi:hypothetical protein